VFCLAKLSASNPSASALAQRSTALSKTANLDHWAWCFCRTFEKIEQDFHLKPEIYLKLSAAIITAIG